MAYVAVTSCNSPCYFDVIYVGHKTARMSFNILAEGNLHNKTMGKMEPCFTIYKDYCNKNECILPFKHVQP